MRQADPSNPPVFNRLIRRNEVLELTSLRRTKMYELIRAGKFPRPVPQVTRAHMWSLNAVQAWIEATVNGASAA